MKFLIAAILAGAALAAVPAQAGSRYCAFPEGQEYANCYEGYDYHFYEREYRSRRDCDYCDTSSRRRRD